MQTAEHPENVAALDDQFVTSPTEVNRENIWPVDITGAGKVEDNIKTGSQAESSGDGDRVESSRLAGGKDKSKSGKGLFGKA